MKSFMRISYISLLLCTFIVSNILPEGFPENTKVHTSSGIKLIQDVRVGDTVINFNKKTQQYTHGEVVNIQKKPTKSLMRLKIGDETIQVHRRQKFLNADTREWCDARDITPRKKLVAQDGNPLIVDEVYKEKECGDVHTLTIKKHSAPYTYCVGDRKTVAHNAAFVLPAVPAVGAVVAEVGTGIAVAGTAVAETVIIGATAIANTGIVTAIHTAASASAAAVYSAASGVAGWAAGLFGSTAAGTTATGMTAAGKAGLLTLAKAKVGMSIPTALQTAAAAVQGTVSTVAPVVMTTVAGPTVAAAATASAATAVVATVPVAAVATTGAVTTTAAATTGAAVTGTAATVGTAIFVGEAVVSIPLSAAHLVVATGQGIKRAFVATKNAIANRGKVKSKVTPIFSWRNILKRNPSKSIPKTIAAMKTVAAAGRSTVEDLMSLAKRNIPPPSIPRPDGWFPGSPGGGPDPQEWIKKSLEWIQRQIDSNKEKHIFPTNNKHGFDKLVDKFGSKEGVMLKMLKELLKNPALPLEGFIDHLEVTIEETRIIITGVVDKVESIIKIGSSWIK